MVLARSTKLDVVDAGQGVPQPPVDCLVDLWVLLHRAVGEPAQGSRHICGDSMHHGRGGAPVR